MSDENIVPLTHAPATHARSGQALSLSINGQPAFLDVVTGDTYDARGASLGRWAQADDDVDARNALSSYVADQNARLIASNLLNGAHSRRPEAVRAQAEQVIALTAAGTPEEYQQALDIGVSDVHIPSATPNFISGYTNEGGVADIYSPPLLTTKNRDYYYQYDHKDAFQRAIVTVGGAGAAYPMVEPRFGSTMYTVTPRACGGFVPTEVESNQDIPLRIKQATLRRILNAMVLEREFRVANLARTSGNWNAATTILSGYQWNGGANSDPIKDIHNAIESSAGRPNGIIIPEPIWNAMRRNPAVRSYYAYKSDVAGIMPESQMMALLDLPTVYVARMKYINSAGTLSYVWGNDVVLFRSPSQIPPMDQGDTASSYTFRWTGPTTPDTDPSQVPGRGMVVRQFFNQYQGSLGGITMVLTHQDAERQTGAYIGNLLINAWQ